ncbi:hypothetical protein AAVH_26452 [Aphelenchoides avenae]|nr:hypothetical protein AAVH_26452 [Aphelenchus avenae]
MSTRMLRSAKVDALGMTQVCLPKSTAAERFPTDCWQTVLDFLPRESLEKCEMSCQKLRSLTAKSHITAKSPARRLCVRIFFEDSTFSVKTTDSHNSSDWLSVQTCYTIPELLRMLEGCLRAHVVVDRLILLPGASAKLASRSGRGCENFRLEARVRQLRMDHVPFSGRYGRRTFFSMFNSLQAIAFAQHYDERVPAVQLSGDDLRMLATMNVSGVYMSTLVEQPSITTADILCFLFDRADSRKGVILQLSEPNIDGAFLSELVERHLTCNHSRRFTLTVVDPCEQRVDHQSIKPLRAEYASPPLLSGRWAIAKCATYQVNGAAGRLKIVYNKTRFLTVCRTSKKV